jgi:hypothetical protein
VLEDFNENDQIADAGEGSSQGNEHETSDKEDDDVVANGGRSRFACAA